VIEPLIEPLILGKSSNVDHIAMVIDVYIKVRNPWGHPNNHPVVMDDHDLVLKQPWCRLGIPHDLRNPQI